MVEFLSPPEAAPFASPGLYLPLRVVPAWLYAIKEVATIVCLTSMLLRHRPAVTHLIAAKTTPDT